MNLAPVDFDLRGVMRRIARERALGCWSPDPCPYPHFRVLGRKKARAWFL